MRDTSEIHDGIHVRIHVSQMHPDRYVSDMKETCGIHKGYMRDTCILRGNQDTCRDTCGIHVGYMWDTCGIPLRSALLRHYDATHAAPQLLQSVASSRRTRPGEYEGRPNTAQDPRRRDVEMAGEEPR